MNYKCNYCVYSYTTILSETGMGCNNLNLCTDNSLFKPTEEWLEMCCKLEKEQKEMINHPSHYNKGKYEAIEVIEDWQLNFNLGNTVKYIARAGHKDNIIQDLKKSLWYLQREIDRLEKGE